MATIGNSYLSLIDMFRNGGDPASADVAEVLNRLSPVVRNAFTVEANSGTLHKHSIRTGLPAVTWGRLYQGIPQSKSTRANVTDTTGFVEGLSTVDVRLLDISPNPAATRMSEAKPSSNRSARKPRRSSSTATPRLPLRRSRASRRATMSPAAAARATRSSRPADPARTIPRCGS
jgi:hypothetical protein